MTEYVWKDLVSESEILELLQVKKEVLGRLRRDKYFPFVRVSKVCRVYIGRDVAAWMAKNRRNLS